MVVLGMHILPCRTQAVFIRLLDIVERLLPHVAERQKCSRKLHI